MATVEEIMNLDFFKNNQLKLIAGQKGLNRIVTRPNIAQLMNFADWMAGGEFLLINGVGLDLDKKENMLRVIENANRAKAACIVFEVSDQYIPKIHKEAIALSNSYQLPIFTLSWNVSFGQILNTVYAYIVREEREEFAMMDIMRNILFVDVNPGSVLQQADYYGYDLRSSHQCFVVREKHSSRENFYNELKKDFRKNKKILYIEQNGNLIVFYPYGSRKHLRKRLGHLGVYVGIGDECSDILKYSNSYNQALQALRFVMVTKEENIMHYDDLGLLRLLDDSNGGRKIKKYIRDYLTPLQEYQENYAVDLIESLDVYQECNFNVSQASKRLFIHRNTMLQRLEKISSLLDVDLNNFNVRREIMDVMHLKKYYG